MSKSIFSQDWEVAMKLSMQLAVWFVGVCLSPTVAGAENLTSKQLFNTGAYRIVLEKYAGHDTATVNDVYYVGLAQLMTGDTNAALSSLRKLLKRSPGQAQFHYALAAVHFHRFNNIGAFGKLSAIRNFRRELNQSLALDPNHLSANLIHAFFLLEAPKFLGGGQNRFDAQREKLRLLHPAYGDYLDGYVAEQEANLALAESKYKAALRKYADFPRAIYALGALNLVTTDYDEAITYALLYSELKVQWDDPQNFEGDWLRGRILKAQSKNHQSVMAFRAAQSKCHNPRVRKRIEKELQAVLESSRR